MSTENPKCTASTRPSAEEKLAELISAVRSINCHPRHQIMIKGDDKPCFWQRGEWVNWVLGLCTEAEQLLNQQHSRERGAAASCLWKREMDSGIYETGCGQTWAFTDGTTPDENSACFCHHCGGVLQVQQLIAYQVGENDIVAAYDPAGAIEVLTIYSGYDKSDFTVDDVVPVNDETLDSTEAFDQDEGKTITLEKTLREELEELTEPTYLHGWE